jgi:endonuclease/exonuclease/phosphatase (EEP) superfamily protein YafD
MNSLPLPLELTKPVLLAGDLNSEVRAQMCSASSSAQKSASLNALGVIQVDATDVQVDDVIG